MAKINLTIDSDAKKTYIQVDNLATDNSTVTGTDYFFTSNIRRMRADGLGWWFDRITDDEFNKKIMFADIILLNAAPIGATTYAQVTALLLAAIETEANQV